MTEIISPEPCLPQICLIEDCLTDLVNTTDYSVGVECSGKDGVSVELYIADIQPDLNKRKKYGNCGTGRWIAAVLYVEIFVSKCSKQSKAAAIANQIIQDKLCTSNEECCADIGWLKTERQVSPKDEEEETWTVMYSLSYFDPQAK